ncbi:bifunctional methylenetetrahydrofolate dehydrogenase/cyclohydrolase, mitochondrial isoform X2 [Eurytemora carolleeae]|uniref:bifunctional methylenetetrahydrofolate dehydrogenase/cyclohydrolase, mitochondrial isoform X2 n=1 Tax=Eurytemora carolleeae TaxID=1294199 RepID=UPI000C7581F4|nr:bifunctional methylenetetrahydrofolate dehydrogenase/cyclohydrolase, mitochondrial isoform X2 [Eurytemora carolleeae]|eukprot:XP_023344615.1 bifunctional methylenetetrahydrofolate dehydrogenase/cyclohydrolase, mitochondrial-like isoform X2 [Eurytemora affinis]
MQFLKSLHSKNISLKYLFIRRELATIFNGHQLANKIKREVKEEILLNQSFKSSFSPQFVAIAVGHNPASKIYLEKKQEVAEECGLKGQVIHLSEDTFESKILGLIHDLNEDPSIHGIIVQLPLPLHLSEIQICNAVHPSKDVDGFTQTNLGKLMQTTESTILPCTALAVKRIVEELKMITLGKNAVVIGRSHNVGLPISIILGADMTKGGFDMTTVSCHRATPTHQLTRACLGADLIVSAAGVPGLVNKYLIKPGSILIDVGLNRIRTAAGKNIVVGDMTKDVNEVAGVVTPVPGGVGPCTVACLMYNTLLAAKLQNL